MKQTTRHYLLCAILFALLTGCSDTDSFYAGSESGQGGSMARFTIKGDHLYTVDSYNLRTFDISDPQQPTYLGGKDQSLGFDIETIFAMDTLLFIGSQTGMFIFNIARPDFPQELSYVSHISSCDPVVASGNYAYVTLNSENTWCGRWSNELHVYDISNPKNPELVATQSSFVHPRGLGIDGKKLFICDNGLKVYSLDDPENPVWIDDLTHLPEAADIDAYDVIPMNGTLFLIGADGFYQFDYSGDKLAYISKIEVKRD